MTFTSTSRSSPSADGPPIFPWLSVASLNTSLLQVHARTERLGAAAAQEFGNRAAREAQVLRDLVEVFLALLERGVHLFLALAEQLRRVFLAILRIEFGAHVRERLLLPGLDFLELDDVISELRLHRAGDVADLHRKQRVAERTGKLLLLDEAELAAVFRGDVGGIFLREFGEILAGARFGQRRLRPS